MVRTRVFYEERGFSLVELLIVLGMLSVFMASVYSLYLTHQRAATVEEEAVDVQQNLRIAMEGITRDLKMSGFLVPPDDPSTPNGLGDIRVSVGNYADAVSPNSDSITLNAASSFGVYAWIDADQTGVANPFSVDSYNDVDFFSEGTPGVKPGDYVRIIRPTNRRQATAKDLAPLSGAIYQVVAKTAGAPPAAKPTITLQTVLIEANTSDPATTEFSKGDVMAKVSNNASYPNTIRYFLTAAGCPAGQQCLARATNEGTGASETQIIATNITDLQFQYRLADDVTITSAPADLSQIMAVEVIITGATSSTVPLSQGVPKQRTIRSVVQLRNARDMRI